LIREFTCLSKLLKLHLFSTLQVWHHYCCKLLKTDSKNIHLKFFYFTTDNQLLTTHNELFLNDGLNDMSFIRNAKKHNDLRSFLMTIFVSTILFFLSTPLSIAGDVVIAWDPNTESDLAGYSIYVSEGSSGPPYDHVDTYLAEKINLDNPRSMITDLEDEIAYYFVVTAFDTEGNESGYSKELCVENGQACTGSIIAGSSSGDDGGGYGGCFISASIY
jgi:hypothetical protein